jgi:hypothetical protein
VYQCDETRPVCTNCAKRNQTCSFTTAESSLIVVNSPYSQSSSNPEDFGTAKDVTSNPSSHFLSKDTELTLAMRYSLKGDDNDTHRLMHHFAISTSCSISSSQSGVLLMREMVPALAFEHDFLFSGILAVTALHLAIILPSAVHSAAASKHHSQALTLIRPHLVHVTPDNVSALFSFSILIASYSFGIHETPCLNPIGEMVDVFTLLRGIGDIVRAGAQWLEQGPFAQQSMLPTPSNRSASLAPKLEAAFSSLSTHNLILITDPAARAAYSTAIGMLRDTFLLSAENPGAMMTVLPFPILVPPEFMERLRKRESMALVILAYYGLVMFWLRHHIWLRGWGKQIVDAVTHAVGPEWRKCLESAIEQVEGQDGSK